MGRVPDIKGIKTDDMETEYKNLVDRVAYSVNTFMDQSIYLFNGNIDFQNLNQSVKDIDIQIDSSGNLINPPSIRTELNTKVQGVLCIKATNLLDSSVYPTSAPWVSFDILNSSTISLLNVSGLQNDSQYRLRLLLIGS